MSTLRTKDLTKSYGGRTVVRDVTIEVAAGEIVGLLGPNGAGKTTCFYAVAGLVPPDRGTILIDGRDVTWLPMYRRAKLGIGYLPQEASIFRGMTVADNIRAVAKVKGLSVPDMTVCILDRPRHAQLIDDVRKTGARIRLITDGDVAGAVGLAIAPAGGQADRIFRNRPADRDHALAAAREEALARAIHAGADPDRVAVVAVNEAPLAYMDDPAIRIRVKAAGPRV